MDKLTFEDGVKTKNATVTINEQEYEVSPAQYQGNTPLSSYAMNKMQDNIEKSVTKISKDIPDTSERLWIQRGKNRFNKYGAFDFGVGSEPPVLQEDGTLLAVKSQASGYAKQQRLFLEKNTTYVVSGKVISINSDNPDAPHKLAVPLVLAYTEGNTVPQVLIYKNISEIGPFEYTINTGDYDYFGISLAYNFSTGNTGNVVYDEIMVSKEGGGYEDYVEDKIFIKENNSFSELINIDKLREERYEQLYSGSATTGTILDLPKDLTLFSKLMIKIGNLDVYIPVELFTGKTIFSGTNTNPTADTVELLTLKFNTVDQYNNRIAFSRIAKWVLSASGITKDASVNTVTEIWGRR